MQSFSIKRIQQEPFFTWLFLAMQTITFVLGYILPNDPLKNAGVLYGPSVVFLQEYWRFITPIFLHFGLMHFAVNSVVLYFMGKQIEQIYGHTRFFILYLGSGIMGNLMSFAFNQPGIISAGSSTSLFGLFGAFVVLGFHFRHQPGIQAMVRQFGLFLILTFAFGAFDQSIDIWGHVGGLLGGILFGNSLALPKNKKNYSIHIRILSGILCLFFIIFFLMYGFKKYL